MMGLFFLGTTLKKNEFEKITGYPVNEYIKERSDLIKEILIRRSVAPTTKIRKLKFFSLPMRDFQKFADKHSQVMLALTEGVHTKSYVAFTVENQKDVFEKVNATYSYGDMSDETREKYIADLDKEFGDKLIALYESPNT